MNELVSVIITTKNEESVIEKLLKSIKKQTYRFIEIIIVDNSSSDKTKIISKKYTNLVFNKGPERSAQRNFGGQNAKGKFLLFLDADMILDNCVVEKCVEVIGREKVGGIIIPEMTIGEGFWSEVKAYERSFYVGDDDIEAARFYPKEVFLKLGKYDESMTGPEDWDFSQRVRKSQGLGRIKNHLIHDEGEINLFALVRKKYYYAKSAKKYLSKNNVSYFSPQTIFFLRKSFYRKPGAFISHPLLSCAMILMLTAELFAGGIGYHVGKSNEK